MAISTVKINMISYSEWLRTCIPAQSMHIQYPCNMYRHGKFTWSVALMAQNNCNWFVCIKLQYSAHITAVTYNITNTN